MSEKTAEELAEEAKKRKEAAADRARLNRIALMAGVQGREFVFELLDGICGLYSGSFAGEATHTAAYNEGQRAVGLLVQRQMQQDCPELFLRMMGEAFARSQVEPKKHETDQ